MKKTRSKKSRDTVPLSLIEKSPPKTTNCYRQQGVFSSFLLFSYSMHRLKKTRQSLLCCKYRAFFKIGHRLKVCLVVLLCLSLIQIDGTPFDISLWHDRNSGLCGCGGGHGVPGGLEDQREDEAQSQGPLRCTPSAGGLHRSRFLSTMVSFFKCCGSLTF